MANIFTHIHESAYIDEGVIIGEGTKVWHCAHVMAGAKIGKNCMLGDGVFIGPNVEIGNNVRLQNNVYIPEGVTLEDYVFCGPAVTFTNDKRPRSEFPKDHAKYLKTKVERGVTIGANATIIGGIFLGQYSFVGAGSVVTKNVFPHTIVYGNPAIFQGHICCCGEPLEKFVAGKMTCPVCKKAYKGKKNGLGLCPLS